MGFLETFVFFFLFLSFSFFAMMIATSWKNIYSRNTYLLFTIFCLAKNFCLILAPVLSVTLVSIAGRTFVLGLVGLRSTVLLGCPYLYGCQFLILNITLGMNGLTCGMVIYVGGSLSFWWGCSPVSHTWVDSGSRFRLGRKPEGTILYDAGKLGCEVLDLKVPHSMMLSSSEGVSKAKCVGWWDGGH